MFRTLKKLFNKEEQKEVAKPVQEDPIQKVSVEKEPIKEVFIQHTDTKDD